MQPAKIMELHKISINISLWNDINIEVFLLMKEIYFEQYNQVILNFDTKRKHSL